MPVVYVGVLKGTNQTVKPHWEQDGNRIYQGHVLEVLKGMADESVQMVVTSPPYW